MVNITLVTGNKGKLAEWRRILSTEFSLDSIDYDLPEIQSLDSKEIVEYKLQAAYKKYQQPLVVEDVGISLTELNGLPGPFIKFFQQALGSDALFKLVRADPAAIVTCTIGYYNGTDLVTFQGQTAGQAVAPRGNNGFGFDETFQPNGSDKTYAEMTPAEKDAVSHRAKAIKQLADYLRNT